MLGDLDLRVKEDAKYVRTRHKLLKLIEIIKLTMNPFPRDIEKSFLFNTISGKRTKDVVVSFLLNVECTGREARDKLIGECMEDTTKL